MKTAPSSPTPLPRQVFGRVAIGYLAFGVAWILGSDQLAQWLAPDEPSLAVIQRFKGLAFVLLSAALIYLMDRKERGYQQRIQEQNRQFQEVNEQLERKNQELEKVNQERASMMRDLLQAKQQAEASDRLKTSFLANLSHEVRTPMNGIVGFSEMLLLSKLDEHRQREYLRIIRKSCLQLLDIINDIVDVAKLESGQMAFSPSSSSLNEILDSVHADYEEQARDKQLRLVHYPGLREGDDLVLVDEDKLVKTLRHLVSNAVKFTEQGIVEFGYDMDLEQLHFFVKDTGQGISEQDQQRIFDIFSDSHVLKPEDFDGLGVGLTLVKSFVEVMGGSTRIDSVEGLGMNFHFRLPYQPARSAAAQHEAAPPASLADKTILVVDDQEINYKVIAQALASSRPKLLWARDGTKAIELLQGQNEVDLVLMDLKMPVMGGLEATRRLRAMGVGLPIIAQTAYTFAQEQQEALEAGCDDFVAKPLDRKVLVQKIANLLARGQS